ncbi:ankyrin repeat and SAM domain-containing protein 3 [Elysia marginata]|uniref:Ankyrin repeat and SAM domain-containing protein 3 n=1 Tax=Elysia marginata TaxID=1093978 RepID=A0AAV4GLD2_9GAST|nr:ankyrin repeat and SAM domain-containing protein 3 [Elysia marginata]
MASELSYETSDDTSENELLERSLSVWRGWSAIELEDFTPIALDIHTACSIGHYDWVRTIIRRNEGIDLDRKNFGGWTPLMYACYIGHDNIVSLLINAGGCNMNTKNPRGLTPLMLAASCGNESVARLLIRRGANVELLDKSGWTALFHATYAGHQNFVAFLLEAEANKDAV